MELPKFLDRNSISRDALPLYAVSLAQKALTVILRGPGQTLYLEWEQREEHFKKPDICGKSCRLQTDCRQYEKQETPL